MTEEQKAAISKARKGSITITIRGDNPISSIIKRSAIEEDVKPVDIIIALLEACVNAPTMYDKIISGLGKKSKIIKMERELHALCRRLGVSTEVAITLLSKNGKDVENG